MTTDTPDEDSVGPKPAEDKAQQKDRETAPAVPPLCAEPRLPTTVKSKGAAKDEKSYRLEKWRFRVEILTLIVLTIYASVAYHQWEEMRRAATAAKEGADAATRAATAAENTFDLNKDFAGKTLTEMQKQSNSMKMAAQATKNQANISQKNLDASNRQSKAALDTTIKNTRLDERPWVTISEFRMSAEPEDKKEFTITCALVNSGKTPALDFVPQSQVLISKVVPPMTKFQEPQTAVSRSIIAPGPTTMKFITTPWVIPTDAVSHYTEKTATLYLHALLTYKDIFGKDHRTSVCVSHPYGSPLNEFTYCEQGNQMDKDEGPSSGEHPN